MDNAKNFPEIVPSREWLLKSSRLRTWLWARKVMCKDGIICDLTFHRCGFACSKITSDRAIDQEPHSQEWQRLRPGARFGLAVLQMSVVNRLACYPHLRSVDGNPTRMSLRRNSIHEIVVPLYVINTYTVFHSFAALYVGCTLPYSHCELMNIVIVPFVDRCICTKDVQRKETEHSSFTVLGCLWFNLQILTLLTIMCIKF